MCCHRDTVEDKHHGVIFLKFSYIYMKLSTLYYKFAEICKIIEKYDQVTGAFVTQLFNMLYTL